MLSFLLINYLLLQSNISTLHSCEPEGKVRESDRGRTTTQSHTPGLTLLYVVDKSLEFGNVFSLFSQGIKDHVIVR